MLCLCVSLYCMAVKCVFVGGDRAKQVSTIVDLEQVTKCTHMTIASHYPLDVVTTSRVCV